MAQHLRHARFSRRDVALRHVHARRHQQRVGIARLGRHAVSGGLLGLGETFQCQIGGGPHRERFGLGAGCCTCHREIIERVVVAALAHVGVAQRQHQRLGIEMGGACAAEIALGGHRIIFGQVDQAKLIAGLRIIGLVP